MDFRMDDGDTMDKTEFLEVLRQRLAETLTYEKVEENIHYYENYISERTNQGYSEKQVIEELGDPLLIAKTIMSAGGEDTRTNTVIYDETPDIGEGENGSWNDPGMEMKSIHTQVRGGCLLAAVIVVLVVAVILWFVGSVISILLPILIPLLVIMMVIAYVKQK